MIHRITGTLVEVDEEGAVVSVGGLAYRLSVPPIAVRGLADLVGEEITLHTLHYIQGAVGVGNLIPSLIGFTEPHHRDFFQELLKVQGLGPKGALRLLDEPVAEIAAAILRDDRKFLRRLPGIGPRRASDLVARLGETAARFVPPEAAGSAEAAAAAGSGAAGAGSGAGPGGRSGGTDMPGGMAGEAIQILLQLGYAPREARRMVEAVLADEGGSFGSTEEVVSEIFRRRG